ncbi:unnamed protein product, partial [Mesorhabditis spiculigera]
MTTDFDTQAALVEEVLGDLHIQRVAAMLLSPSPRDTQLLHDIHQETQTALNCIQQRTKSVERKAKERNGSFKARAPPPTARAPQVAPLPAPIHSKITAKVPSVRRPGNLKQAGRPIKT